MTTVQYIHLGTGGLTIVASKSTSARSGVCYGMMPSSLSGRSMRHIREYIPVQLPLCRDPPSRRANRESVVALLTDLLTRDLLLILGQHGQHVSVGTRLNARLLLSFG
jgi:hypothetical protein